MGPESGEGNHMLGQIPIRVLQAVLRLDCCRRHPHRPQTEFVRLERMTEEGPNFRIAVDLELPPPQVRTMWSLPFPFFSNHPCEEEWIITRLYPRG
jgi:hypothetical protein